MVGVVPPCPFPPGPSVKGQQASAACPKDRRLGEEKFPTPDTRHGDTGRPPPGCPPAALTARETSSQECALWGWLRALTPAPPASEEKRAAGPSGTPQARTVGGSGVRGPGRPSTQTGNRKRDARPGPPPPTQRQAKQGTRAENAGGQEPRGTVLPAFCEARSRNARAKRQREVQEGKHCGCTST